VAAASFALPALGFAFGPIFKSNPHRWEVVGNIYQFPDNNYVPVVITLQPNIGEAGKSTGVHAQIQSRKSTPTPPTWTRTRRTSRSPAAARTSAARCAGVDASEALHLPCHGGVYDLLGRRVGGPPSDRSTASTPASTAKTSKVGPRFSVNSQLRRFSPRDPGEPLDGIGQYMYPSRPGAQKL